MMEWFKEFFEDLIQWFYEILLSIFNFVKDIFLVVFELLLDGIVFVFSSIQPPDFLLNGIDTLTAAIHPDIIYFLGMSGLDTALAIYGSGVAFRMLRKLVTLGQW